MTDNTITTLNQDISNITLYVPYFTIIIGTLGGFCNLLTFTSRRLRSNTCAFYFLCSTIFDLIYLLLGAVTRLMSDHYSYVLPRESTLFCKLRTYLSVVVPVTATFFIALSSIDRCLLSMNSRKWRSLSQIKLARWIAVLSIGFWALCFSHTLIYYQLRLQDANNNIYVCIPQAGIYTTFVSIFYLVCNTIFMYTIMLLASLITIIRIRTSRNRVIAPAAQRPRLRNIDRHLITIMFFQVGIGLLLTSFRWAFLAYSLLTNTITKSLYRMTIESFIDQLSLTIYYLNSAKSFPVNTLTSPLFRNIFYQRILKIWHR